MKFDDILARKLTRMIIQEATRQSRQNNREHQPIKNDVQVRVQYLLNAIKKELKRKKIQVF